MASALFSKDDYIKQRISKVTCDENILKYYGVVLLFLFLHHLSRALLYRLQSIISYKLLFSFLRFCNISLQSFLITELRHIIEGI